MANVVTQTAFANSSGSVFDFPGNPNYSPYYNFAKYKLFDGQDFFTSGSSFATCPQAVPQNQADLENQLTLWGFKTTGDLKTVELLQETFATVCLLYQSSTYTQLLGAQKNPITLTFDSRPGGGGGLTEGNLVHLYNPVADATNENRFFLTHELTHVLSNRNSAIQQNFDNNVFPASPQLTSINCSIQQDVPTEESECLADAVGLYLVYPEFTAWASEFQDINNYPDGKYKLYYQFVRDSIFGGIVYFASPSTIADYATALNLSIQHNCPADPPFSSGRLSIVNQTDVDCLSSLVMNPPIQQNVVTTLINGLHILSPNPIKTLQCVGFAEAVSVGTGADIGSREARSYEGATNIPGYQWINNTPSTPILPGDFLVWGDSGSSCEHIAVVTETSGSDGLKIAEASGSDGDVRIQDTSRSHEQQWCPLHGWLRKQ